MIYWLDCLIFLCRNMRDGIKISAFCTYFFIFGIKVLLHFFCLGLLKLSRLEKQLSGWRVFGFQFVNILLFLRAEMTQICYFRMSAPKNLKYRIISLFQIIWSAPELRNYGKSHPLCEVLKVTISNVCGGVDLKELTCLVPMYWSTLPDFQFSLLSVQFDPFSVWEAWWGRKPAKRNGLQWFPNE